MKNIVEIQHCVFLVVKKEVGDNYTHPGTEVFNNCEIDEDYEYGYEEEQEYFMVSNLVTVVEFLTASGEIQLILIF